MINPHIVRKTTSPVTAPPEAGIHWINTVTGEEYFSVATSSVNDWIIRKNNGTWLNGSGVPSAGLGNDGDNYINNDNGDYYKKVSGSWVLQGNLQGPAGATGATGATGAPGSPGAPGSQIYTGAGVPSPLLGIDGDFYVDSTGSAYYHKASGAWVMQGSFGGVTDHGALTGLADNDHPQYLLVSNFNTQNLAMKEPTGFPNRTDSAITFDDFTRTLFISATGASFDVWVKGTKYTFPNLVAIGEQISTTAGNHYIYFDSTGNLTSTTTFNVSLFQDNAMCAIVYWNSDTNTHTYLGDERHGMQMDGATHGYLHTVFGTRYLTGLALQSFSANGDGSANSHAQFTVDSGSIRDEDILLSILAQAQIPILFRQGSLWRKKAQDSYPLIYNGTAGYTGTRIPFNEFVTGNWQLTEIVNGNYVLVHYFATNDQDNPVIGILGTNQYTNAPQARSACESEISSLAGLPFAEFTAIGSVIFQSNSAYTNVPKARVVSSNPTIGEIYVDFRGEQLYTPSGVATSHSLLSNLTSDDHLHYHTDARGDARYLQLTGGTVTGQTVISGASSLGQSLVRITNTGAGDTFVVEDSANPDTSNFKIDSNGFIFTGSLLSTSGVSGRMQILDLSNAFIECKAGSTRAVSFGASTTGNGFRSSLGPLDISTTDSGDAITISPVQGDGFGSSIYTTSNGSMLVTGINNIAPTEALDVTGNVKASGTVLGSNLSGTNTGDETTATIKTKLGSASSTQDGYLTYTDWTTFNSKEPALTKGNLTSSTTGVTITGGTGSVIGSGSTVDIQTASGSQPGLLSASDWTTFNNKLDNEFIPKLSGIETYRGALYQNNSTTVTTENITALLTNGTATARSVANTNQLTKQVRMAYAVSTPASSAVCGVRSSNLLWSIGSGFKMSFSFAYTDSQLNIGARQFYGMHSLSTGITISSTATVESLTNMFCIGSDASDTSLCIFYNDASGVASKIVLGATDFPANRGASPSTDIFSVDFYNETGTSTVKYRVVNLTTMVKAEGTLSTDLPSSSTLLTFQAIRTSGSSSNPCSMDLTKLGVWSIN